MLNSLYSLYIIIIVLSRILERKTNNEKFAHSIIKSKNNSDNIKVPRLIIY